MAILDEIGVSKQRLAEWRVLRDAGPEAVDTPIDAQLAQFKAPTKSGIQAILAGLTGNNEWQTPAEWIERSRAAMGSIDCDPASHAWAQRTVRAGTWYCRECCGLRQSWHGNVWLNPPYGRGQIEAFVEKLVAERPNYRQAVVLTSDQTDTAWFHRLCSIAAAIAFTRGRISFHAESGEAGKPPNGSRSYISETVSVRSKSTSAPSA